MREILFRAKLNHPVSNDGNCPEAKAMYVENGIKLSDQITWVFGNNICINQDPLEGWAPGGTRGKIEGVAYLHWLHAWDEVDPETIGQFTGMLDKNGNKIFEGDILCWCGGRADWRDDEFTRLEMRWVDDYPPAFCAVFKNGDLHNSFELKLWTVVGNIHDNPELLSRETTHVVDSNG